MAVNNVEEVNLEAKEEKLNTPENDTDIMGWGKNKIETVKKTPFIAEEYQNFDGNNYSKNYDNNEDFIIPKWGYDNFILERTNFQKSVTSLFSEPAFFYFKIFFKFNTGYGLLGPDGFEINLNQNKSVNSALSYLHNLEVYMSDYYGNSNLSKRRQALERFINILSYINSQAPWFFKNIKGLDKIEQVYDLNTDDNIIEIGCLQEAIDMRLQTLLGLYKYACWDNYNNREIIPENLRMFDMAVMVFQTPIRYYHTGMMSRSLKEKFPYKSNKGDEKMSYKIILFKNCEIHPDSFKTILPGDLNNEKPTAFENISIKIKYQKALVYNYNEFFNLLYGDDTLYDSTIYPNENVTQRNILRFKAIRKSLDKLYYYNPYSTEYKDLIDASESIMRDGMRMVIPEYCMGNIYGTKFNVGTKYFNDKLSALKNGTIHSGNIYGDANDTNSDYFKTKLSILKNRSIFGNIYGDANDINSSYSKEKLKYLNEPSVYGGLYGEGSIINSSLFKLKLKLIKQGSIATDEEYERALKATQTELKQWSTQGNYKYKNGQDNLKSLINGNNVSVNHIDIKSLIHEKSLSYDEKKKNFWQELYDNTIGDTLDEIKETFSLKNMLKF